MTAKLSMSEPPPKDAGLFGTYLDENHDRVIVIGVPWEVSVSYGRGTSLTPEVLVPASHQLDFFDLRTGQNFGEQVGMLPLNRHWQAENTRLIALAAPIIAAGGAHDEAAQAALAEINAGGSRLNRELAELTRLWQAKGKRTAVLGGDHSSPLGHIAATLERFPGAGILHFDAHHDLRVAYEGFTYSHASIMYNVVNEVPQLGQLTSVGIRDFCQEEHDFARDHHKIATFYDRHLREAAFQGKSWHLQSQEILATLPELVYVSFDIDGLQPVFCPNTGTPVPGGLTFDQAIYLLEQIPASGRRLIGFDLCEVAPDSREASEWDLNVGSRLLWRLCQLLDEAL